MVSDVELTSTQPKGSVTAGMWLEEQREGKNKGIVAPVDRLRRAAGFAALHRPAYFLDRIVVGRTIGARRRNRREGRNGESITR